MHGPWEASRGLHCPQGERRPLSVVLYRPSKEEGRSLRNTQEQEAVAEWGRGCGVESLWRREFHHLFEEEGESFKVVS